MRQQRRYGTVTATSSGLIASNSGAAGGASSFLVTSSGRAPLPGSARSTSTAAPLNAPPSPTILDGPHRAQPIIRREFPEEKGMSELEPLLLGGSSSGGEREGERNRRRSGRRRNNREGPGAGASPAAGAGGGGGVFSPGSSRRDNGKALTTVLMLSYMIGSGILNSAQVFNESGVGTATILYITAAGAIWFGMVVLISAAEAAFPRGNVGDSEDLEDLDFADLAAKTLGPYGAISVDVSIVVQNVGDVCSYVILVGSLSASLLKEWIGGGAGEAWTSFSVVTPMVVLLLVYPPCLIRHLSNLRWLSALCLAAITAVVCFVMIEGPINAGEDRSEPDHDPALDAAVVCWDLVGSVSQLGSIVFALSCSVAALHAYTAMFPRSERAWRSVAAWAIAVGLVLCYSTGLLGYLSFRDATEGDILDNFDGAVASFFKALMVVHLILYIPSEVLLIRHSLFAMRGHDVMEAQFWPVALVTFFVLAIITGTMVGFEAIGVAEGDLFGYILDLTGGIAGSATSFVLPGLTYLGATKEEAFTSRGYGHGRSRFTYLRTGCQALVCFGVVVMIAVPLGVVVSIAGS